MAYCRRRSRACAIPGGRTNTNKGSEAVSELEYNPDDRPVVIITGLSGKLGRSIAESLADRYRIVGLDRINEGSKYPTFKADFASDASVELALRQLASTYGEHIASVIHLVAYFDFTGEDNVLYRDVNVEGTRRLLRGLQRFKVEQFIYCSTMLVHKACRPGERIDENQPVDPRWAYPNSKLAAEEVVQSEHGHVPYVLLRLAGVYDERSMVPTLAHQIARVYEKDFQSFFYAGSTLVGQAMVHREDMLDAFKRTVERRAQLPVGATILIGESDALGFDALQDELGYLMHGVEDWPTLELPKPIAKAGAWAQGQLAPLVPDFIDGGATPFIQPFMISMADHHYALNTARARDLLGWEPKHQLKNELHSIVSALKDDPVGWYAANGLKVPGWIEHAAKSGENPETLRVNHRIVTQAQHAENRWVHFVNIGLGTWLLSQPMLINVTEPLLSYSEMGLGGALIVFASLAISTKGQWARWVCAAIGSLVMAVPFLFWTTSGAAYLSDTLVGALIFGLAVGTKPEPGASSVAALTGPEKPLGWSYNPSAWTQRLPIVIIAMTGVYISRYLAGYQLGHIPSVWEPFFAGSPTDPRNGTEEIIMSSVAKAWPVSDAAVGAYTYLLEILTGIVGSRMRWRTMPWLVILFGLMIAPLGVISIFFIIIQPIVIGTWSTIAMIGAALILIQIPYSLDEIIATLQFLRRRTKAGQNWFRVLLRGDTDEYDGARMADKTIDEFDRPPLSVLNDIFGGGVNLPWNLAAAAMIGVILLFSRMMIDNVQVANAHHVIGCLVLAVVSVAAAEVARMLRYLVGLLGIALCTIPFLYSGDMPTILVSVVLGVLLGFLCIRRGLVRETYGTWRFMTR